MTDRIAEIRARSLSQLTELDIAVLFAAIDGARAGRDAAQARVRELEAEQMRLREVAKLGEDVRYASGQLVAALLNDSRYCCGHNGKTAAECGERICQLLHADNTAEDRFLAARRALPLPEPESEVG